MTGDLPPTKSEPKIRAKGGKLSWTSQDQKFLRALKISLDDDSTK